MAGSIALDKLTLGVCYYPEHWDEGLWADDLSRMLAAGIEVVRVFEFAWSVVEPREGQYDFALFDRFLDLARRMEMRVILCTPTATPPAWLTHAYPEVLNATMRGERLHHGHRRHYNYASPVYHDFAGKIITALAVRYGDHPAVIGWQIDNEINCEIDAFYSDDDRRAFRAYLERRFGTLEALNKAVGAVFWNQTYTDWQQVDMERPTIHNHANPHMALLEKAYVAHAAAAFFRLQSEALRPHIGDRFITTNGVFGHLDNHAITRESLDFMMYDSYPNFGYGRERYADSGERHDLRDRATSGSLARVRAISPNFGVMEQQSGANGWDFRMVAPMPKPGQMRLWTYQSIAHGADFVSYFRWRTALFGTEIYWHGLNDYGNGPNRRMEELSRIGAELRGLGSVAGSRYEARVAVLSDYLNEWDGERDQWHGPLDHASRGALLEALQLTHTPADMPQLEGLASGDALTALLRYPVVFYPHPTILTGETAALLTRYCEGGGTLVLGARIGYKDALGRCHMLPMPGHARALCGAQVEDYTFVRPEEPQASIIWDGVAHEAPIFHDILAPVDGGEVLGTFSGAYYDGKPALVAKRYPGGGIAYYVGSGFSRTLVEAVLVRAGALTPYADTLACAPEIELACRVAADGTRHFFLLNYAGTPKAVQLRQPMSDALTGQEHAAGSMEMPPYGVMVLR